MGHLSCHALSLLILIACVSGQSVVDLQAQLDNCNSSASQTRVTFPGWPFQLDCKGMAVNENDLTECYTILNESYAPASTVTFRLNFSETLQVFLRQGDSCWKKNITIEVRSLTTASTYDAISDDYLRNKSVVYIHGITGDPLGFDCLPPSNVASVAPYSLALPPTYNITWWRTQKYRNGSLASEILPKEESTGNPVIRNFSDYGPGLPDTRIVFDPPYPHKIETYELDFFDPALYSCEIEHNGERAFVTHQSLCVQNEVNDKSPPKIMCTEHHFFVEGKTAQIKCNAFSSNIMIEPGELVVEWRKEDNNEPGCVYSYQSSNVPSPSDDRYSCSVDGFSNVPFVCFEYVPTEAEVHFHPDRKDFTATLTIRNIRKSDAGNYVVKLRYGNRTSDEFVFTLEFNIQDELRRVVVILVSILSVLIVISLAVMLVWCYWIQIQLFIRRHLGKYDEDGKEYVAILSYVYSDDLPEVTRERTRKIVKCIQEKMKDMNYSFYDSHRYFDQGCTIENLLKYLNESHRMIVILTDAYVDERWSRFEAQQGFLNMLKNRTKLIFVRTPGARKALKKCKQNGDDFSSELNEAMKASRNIRWTEKMSETRFKDHVQYALPNLNRLLSNQTSSNQYAKFENYERSDSRFTQISFASSGDENSGEGDVTFGESRDSMV